MPVLDGFAVLLVDDHPLFREGLALALRQRAPLMDVMAAATLDEAQQLLRAWPQRFDLVLLDYRLPGDNGLVCAAKLQSAFPALACALMSGSQDAALPARAREAGLMGYLPKTLEVEALVHGLERLAQGERYFAPVVSDAGTLPDGVLTPRQREIVRMVGSGATNKEIAQVLQIAPHTVKNHLAQIFDKLGAANRAQAVSMINAGADV